MKTLYLTVKHIHIDTPPYTLKKKHYIWSDIGGEFCFKIHSNNIEKTKTKIISDMLLGACIDCDEYGRVTYSNKEIKRVRKHSL